MRSKKIGCIALAILLAFFLFGCEEDAQISAPIGGAVSNLKAKAFSGGNQITWDPAVDAQSYDIYRRTVGGKDSDAEMKHLTRIAVGTTGIISGGLTYNDIVGFSNQLVDKWQYEYTIVANGRQSLSGRAVTLTSSDYQNSDTSKVRVTAIIPAQGTKLPAPAATMTRVTKLTGTLGNTTNSGGAQSDEFLVTWERTPGAVYQIGYGYALHSDSPHQWAIRSTIVSNNTNNSGYFAKYGSFNIPYVPSELFPNGSGYGKRAEVRAVFADNYYLPSDVVEVVCVDNNPRYDGPITGFTASVPYNNLADSYRDPFVQIQWETSTAYARSYELYRAEAAAADNIISSWTSVTADQERWADANGNEFVRVIDTSVEAGKTYQYMLVATGYNGGKFAAVLNSPARIRSSSMLDPRETFRTGSTPSMSTTMRTGTDAKVDAVRVEWIVNTDDLANATYILYRSEITTVHGPIINNSPAANNTGPSSENIATASWGSPIAQLNMTNASTYASYVSGNTIFFYDTAIASMPTRKHYAYKLVVEREFNDQKTTKLDGGSYRIINEMPFVPYVNISVIASPASSATVAANTINATAFSTDLSLNFVGYHEDVKSSSFALTFLKKAYNDIAFSTAGTGNIAGNVITPTYKLNYTMPMAQGIANIGGQVRYKVEAKLGNTTLLNRANDTIASDFRYKFTGVNPVQTDNSIRFNFNNSSERLAGGIPIKIERSTDGISWTSSTAIVNIVTTPTLGAFVDTTISGIAGSSVYLRISYTNLNGTDFILNSASYQVNK